jgi:ribokinase
MTRRPVDVLVVGSVNVDLVVQVERLPGPGETVTGGTFARHHGGKGANQAVAAARLGAAVAFVGAIGDDDDGRAALADLRAEGVDVSGVSILAGVPTGAAVIVVDRHGENQIAVASGANGALDGAMVGAALAGIEVRRGGAWLANLEIGDEALLAGARWASRRGMLLIVNPAPARPLPSELVAMHPLLVANRREAEVLSEEGKAESAARRLAERTGAAVIITLGPDGALLYQAETVERVAVPPVDAVDTTGAGDTFAGALAAQLAAGADLAEAVQLAVAAAAMSVTQSGARGGMPDRRSVAAALDRWRAGWNSNLV